jgi:hypothetical protein
MPLAGPLSFTADELRTQFELSDAEIKAIEEKQPERNPSWKKGDKLLTHFHDVSHKTGFRPGNF